MLCAMQALLRFDVRSSFHPSFRRRASSRFAGWAIALLALAVGNLTHGAGWDDPTEASWSFNRSLLNRRFDPTSTLLLSGKVLVVGGGGTDVSLITTELYDPATGRWSESGNLVIGRDGHSATLLASARCSSRAATAI
jgi:Kelch motif